MKIRATHIKSVIAIISGGVGGFFGLAGGSAGAIVGIISGILVGYYYGHFILRISGRHALSRFFLRTLYGTIAGLLSGISVHIPSIVLEQKHGLFGSSREAISVGAIFGIIVGTILGFCIACVMEFIQRKAVIEE